MSKTSKFRKHPIPPMWVFDYAKLGPRVSGNPPRLLDRVEINGPRYRVPTARAGFHVSETPPRRYGRGVVVFHNRAPTAQEGVRLRRNGFFARIENARSRYDRAKSSVSEIAPLPHRRVFAYAEMGFRGSEIPPLLYDRGIINAQNRAPIAQTL